jgi:hypothetical protein
MYQDNNSINEVEERLKDKEAIIFKHLSRRKEIKT